MVICVFDRKDPTVLRGVAVIIWGIAVLLSVMVGSAVVLAMLSTEPNWSEITLALATVVMALATAGLALAAFLALGSLGEARAARNAVAAMELGRDWDSDESLDLRLRVTELAKKGLDGTKYTSPGPEGLKSSFETLRNPDGPPEYAKEYGRLLKQPNSFDSLAQLVKHRGIDFDVVYDSIGYNVSYWWSLWKPTVDELRRIANQPLIYKDFEELAKRIAAIDPSVAVDADGEIVWGGFRE
jgi:hypothetical protein